MASDKQRIAQNTLFLYVRMFLIIIVSLYTVRVVIRTLNVTDYGIYTAVGGIVLALSFLSQTIASASQRFFAYELGRKDYLKLKRTFSIIFIVYVIIALAILIIAETLGLWFLNNIMTIPSDRLEAANWVYQFALFSFIVKILTSPYNAIIIARENMKVYAYVSIIEAFLKLLIVYLLVVFAIDKLKLYAVLTFVITCIISAIYGFFCYRRYEESRISLYWDKALFKSVFSYSSWTLFGTMAGVANGQGSNLLLNVFFGPVLNAAYSIAYQVSTVIQQFSGNFFMAIRTPLIKSYAEKNYDYMMQLFYLSTRFSFLLLYAIILPLILEVEFILKLWLGTVGEYMVLFTQLILIYCLVLAIGNPITIIMQAAKKVKLYHGIVDSFVLLTLPLSYLFFKLGYPPESTLIVSISMLVIAHAIRIWVFAKIVTFSLKEYCMQFVFPAVVVVILSVISTMFIQSLFQNGLIQFVVVCLASFLCIGLCSYYIILTAKEKLFLFKVIKNKFK